jgi:hypothetical protein
MAASAFDPALAEGLAFPIKIKCHGICFPQVTLTSADVFNPRRSAKSAGTGRATQKRFVVDRASDFYDLY